MCSPGKEQGAKSSNQKIHLLWDLFPLLKKELIGEGNFGSDYVKLSFRNSSLLDIMSPLNSTRGNRATCGIIDEFRDHSSDNINEIIIPLLNVDRAMKNQEINPYEPQQVQLWISSASDKNTFCYDKTIEMLEMSILNPSKCFCWGFDYRIPVLTGLLSKDFLTEQKLSTTFSELGFAKEYMSRFVGSSNNSWIDYEHLVSRRKIVNPEKHEIVRGDAESFYLLSVDIARLRCQTVCTVLKVFPRPDNFRFKLVNIYILGKTENEKIFDKQVLELKKIMKEFNPREVVIDINGVGAPFGDGMIKETLDPETGEIYPAYAFSNRKEYENIQPRNAPKILYGIKATSAINSLMHSQLYQKIYSGRIDFLISEQEAKAKLMATRRGQRMKPEQRNARLLPHQLTTILFNEITNLRLKPTGANNLIAVEEINKRMGKDKFSALEMGIYRASLLEEEYIARNRNRGLNRKLTFFRKGGR